MTFESVIGQENITQTLLKAIENNHLAQAFLFCGPRGVGKTSCARILARAVNAFHSESGEIDQDFAFNIFELDAASNNSVADIRNLIDQTRIPPQIGKYKVYIIDEVHMLSSNAFNAFLKTLEEPPPYAIFILATTEKHKVLPTIISRCQVFDFNSIQIPDIVKHLGDIAAKEGIAADSDALHIIAEKADGALRDALSIFDQIVGFTGKKVTYQDVINNLNILDYDYYFDMTEAFLRGDKTEVLITLNTILNNGFDGHVFINGLASHFRNLLFCTSERTAAIMEVGTTIQKRYLAQAEKCETRFILNAMHKLSDADINYKSSKNKRLLVELNLLAICALAEQLAQKKNPDTGVAPNSSSQKSTPTSQESKSVEKPIVQKPDDGISTSKATEKSKQTEPETLNNPSNGEKISDTVLLSKAGEAVNAKNLESDKPQHAPASPPKPEQDAIKQESLPDDKKEDSRATDDLGASTSAPGRLNTAEEAASSYKTSNDQASRPNFSNQLKSTKAKGLPSLKSLAEKAESMSAYHSNRTEKSDLQDIQITLHQDRPTDEFNLAELWKVWEEYTELIKKEDKKGYYATLTKHQPIMREKFKVELRLDNPIQVADLEADKLRLLEFLRERLNNWQIQMEGIIDDSDSDGTDSLYDPRKKFEAMNKENPVLGKLKSIFDLDVEHDG